MVCLLLHSCRGGRWWVPPWTPPAACVCGTAARCTPAQMPPRHATSCASRRPLQPPAAQMPTPWCSRCGAAPAGGGGRRRREQWWWSTPPVGRAGEERAPRRGRPACAPWAGEQCVTCKKCGLAQQLLLMQQAGCHRCRLPGTRLQFVCTILNHLSLPGTAHHPRFPALVLLAHPPPGCCCCAGRLACSRSRWSPCCRMRQGSR